MRGCLMVGCGVLVLLVLGLVGSCGYFGWKSAKTVESAIASVHATDDEFQFSAPADRRIVPERFEAYLRVRAAGSLPMRSMLDRFEQLDSDQDKGGLEKVKNVLGVITGSSEVIADTWNATAAALRAERMSVAELEWIARAAHGAVVCAVRLGNKDAAAIVDAFQEDGQPDAQVQTRFGRAGGSYPELRAMLERDCGQFDLANLDVVVAARDRFVSQGDGLTVDLFVILASE